MTRIVVAIPIMRVRFDVDVVQRGVLLPLDTLVIAGIAAGRTSLESLADDLRLTPRLIDTSVIRLVEEELLYLNVQTGDLALTERAQVHWKEERLDRLAFRGEPGQDSFSALQDLTWGTILPYDYHFGSMRFGAPPPGAIKLDRGEVSESVLSLPPVRIAALFNAQPWLVRRRGERQVAIEGRMAGVPVSTHLLAEFAPHLQQGETELWPTSGPSQQGGTMPLRSLLARVRRWLHENPDSWKAMLPQTVSEAEPAGPRYFVPFTQFALLVEWQALESRPLEDLEEDPYAARVREQCDHFRRRSVPLHVVRDSEHIDLCRSLLDGAAESCVIHSAFWSNAGVSQYADNVRGALKQGVRVFLLRGLGEDEKPDDALPIVDQLVADARGLAGELLVSSVPHHSHAKFVVADGCSALVSSFNFLSATRDNPQLNLGVYASERPDKEYSLGRAVLRDWINKAPGGALRESLEQQLAREELQEAIEPIQPEAGSSLTDSLTAFRNWLGSLREPPCAWESVSSEDHRDALLIALHSAEQSITVTSGDMTRSAVDNVLQGYLRNAVGRGVFVRMLWGSHTSDPTKQEQVAAHAKELYQALAPSGRFSINLTPKPIHAKLLIVDDWVSIVTSYNFLSYRGLRHGAHELGIKSYSRSLASHLNRVLDSIM